MSDSEEDTTTMQTGGEYERVSLMREPEKSYSLNRLLGARSFRLGLCISFLVIILIAAAVASTVVILTRGSSSDSDSGGGSTHGSRFTLDDVFNPNFSINYYSAEWTNDNKLIHQSSENGLLLLSPSENSTTTLISPEDWAKLEDVLGSQINRIVLSGDTKIAMIETNIEKVYRHSYLADYTLYTLGDDITNDTLHGIPLPDGVTGRIQVAIWSPTDHVIAYVVDFNLYVYNVTSNDLDNITSDGERNIVYNGIPDWVYEEEILATNYALWWAPDGNKIIYGRFNDSSVKDFQFPFYGIGLPPSETQYTTIDSIAYPKSGTTNPLASVLVTDLTDSTKHILTPPPNIDEDHYFVFVGWVSSDVPMVTWTNRTSNSSTYCLYSELSSWECDAVYDQTSSGWIELVETPTLVKEGEGSILTLVSQPEGDDSFLHILRINPDSSNSWQTEGNWEVTSIVQATDKEILYLSTQTSPSERHLYSSLSKICLTCSQEDWHAPNSSNPSLPPRCEYFSGSCSPSLEYCVLHCQGPTVPYSVLVHYDGDKLKPVRFLEVNSVLHSAVSNKSLPTVHSFTVPSDSGGPSLNGIIMLPPGFKKSEQYPVLVYVYAGPYSQQVANTTLLSSLSLVYFCTNLSIIVAKIDGRGTGYRGDKFKFSVYRDLGHFETIDQNRAGRYLQSLKYVDGSNLAIYGSSYGGYMAGMVGSSAEGVFSAAISQAPVTTWYYYDSVYTERYMDQPQYNEKAYEVSSILSRAGNLSSIDYLLIHGTADDNVHFQHTAQLVHTLTEKGVQFRFQIYTDKAHALSGTVTRSHLYQLIADFLSESFGLK